MIKPTKINIADTNLANFGTPLEKSIKQHASDGEPAWKNAGKAPGIEVWRIEKFKIVPWPKDKYGHFFNGDSYIVLYTYIKDDKMLYNVHFWLGTYTSQDEAGTAAYKTVELDDHLGGLPVQYRECQGHESQAFLKLFPKLVIDAGGVESGFHHVTAVEEKKRLLHVRGNIKHTVVSEVPLDVDSLSHTDVYILDVGLKVFEFQGRHCTPGEKMKAAQISSEIEGTRGKIHVVVLSASQEDDGPDWTDFWATFGGKRPIPEKAKEEVPTEKRMYKISDETGKMEYSQVKFCKSSLEENSVFVADVGPEIFVWIGKKADEQEKKSGLSFAQQYLNDNNRPPHLPIIRVVSGHESEEFASSFH